jgi:glucose/arabinose dehydrogenase
MLAVAALGLAQGLALSAAAEPSQPVGERFQVLIRDLPPPFATPSVSNRSRRIARPAGAALRVPEGFAVDLFAQGLEHPRWMAVAPGGDVLLIEPRANRITLLRDGDGDGRAELVRTFASDIRGPQGIAFSGAYLYVADRRQVWRYPYRPGQTQASGPPQAVTAAGALGGGRGHSTRNIVFDPDGTSFLVAVGSRGNLAVEAEPRATVQRFALDGGGQTTFASGLRNPVGIAFYPGTRDLYVVVNERDGLGDGLVPDYLTRLEPGGFYGWPYAYLGPIPDPGHGAKRPDLVARTLTPDLLFRSHSAPLGLVFYDARQFPPAYRGDAFVALHGSWNSARPTGYSVVRVPFEGGRPKGYYETFLSGFWASGEARAEVWGRPAGLAVAADGSLLIADDAGGAVWRVSYAP